jgi:hypothetical protein
MSPPFLFMTIRELEPEIDPHTKLHKVDNTIRIYMTELDGVPHYRMHARRRSSVSLQGYPYDIVTTKRRDVLRYIRYIIHQKHFVEVSMYVYRESDVALSDLPCMDKATAFGKYETEEYEMVGFLASEYSGSIATRILDGLRVLSAIKAV